MKASQGRPMGQSDSKGLRGNLRSQLAGEPSGGQKVLDPRLQIHEQPTMFLGKGTVSPLVAGRSHLGRILPVRTLAACSPSPSWLFIMKSSCKRRHPTGKPDMSTRAIQTSVCGSVSVAMLLGAEKVGNLHTTSTSLLCSLYTIFPSFLLFPHPSSPAIQHGPSLQYHHQTPAQFIKHSEVTESLRASSPSTQPASSGLPAATAY